MTIFELATVVPLILTLMAEDVWLMKTHYAFAPTIESILLAVLFLSLPLVVSKTTVSLLAFWYMKFTSLFKDMSEDNRSWFRAYCWGNFGSRAN